MIIGNMLNIVSDNMYTYSTCKYVTFACNFDSGGGMTFAKLVFQQDTLTFTCCTDGNISVKSLTVLRPNPNK